MEYFLVLFVKDEKLQEEGEEVVADIAARLVPGIYPLEMLQVEHLYVLLPQKSYRGSKAKQIVVVKVHEGRSHLHFDSVHFFTAEILGASEGRVRFTIKVLFDYFAESEVEENESSELQAVCDIIVFDVVVNDPEEMQFQQVLL